MWLNSLFRAAVARTMCHAGTKGAKPLSLRLSSPSGDSDRAASSPLSRLDQKRQ